MSNCVVVLLNETGERGCITRRLDAHTYEIWLENGSVKILPPSEFSEIERKEK